jgi:very-short-patch-repair endonuclease
LEVFDLRAVQRQMERSRGRRGLKPLTALVAEARPVTVTRSELERRFLDVCRQAGLPSPATNVLVAGFEVDAVWFDWRLVVELDGHAYHRTRAAFERDPIRDAALQVAGFGVLRVTYRRLEREPAEVVKTIRSLRAAKG